MYLDIWEVSVGSKPRMFGDGRVKQNIIFFGRIKYYFEVKRMIRSKPHNNSLHLAHISYKSASNAATGYRYNIYTLSTIFFY